MLRPGVYQQAQVATRDIPYVATEGSSKEQMHDGVVTAGQIVWTQESEPVRAHITSATAFLDGVGLVSLDPQLLMRADVLNEREHKQEAGREVLPSTSSAKEPLVYHPTHEETERLAYSIWEKRARSEGSAEDDWFKAEGELGALGPDALKETGFSHEPH